MVNGINESKFFWRRLNGDGSSSPFSQKIKIVLKRLNSQEWIELPSKNKQFKKLKTGEIFTVFNYNAGYLYYFNVN